ncbi:MAG: lactate/malate family dehydrogenase [Alkalispirochaetaceae bacterium]
MANIGIIGSGNVGANSAFFIAERNIGNVSLYDVQDGLAFGKALDMMEAAPVRGYQRRIAGVQAMDELMGHEAVILAPGSVRTPGMKREELYEQNVAIIDDLAQGLQNFTGVVINAIEPVDALTTRFVETSGLPWNKVLGLGSILDAARLRYLISRETGITAENIVAMVIGRHSDGMLPLEAYTKISGVPLSQIMEKTEIEAIFDELKEAGDLIVEMARRASAYYGPSAVIADLARANAWDTRAVLPVSFVWQGHYGIDGVAMGLPAVIGRRGIERVLEPTLSAAEKSVLSSSAEELAATVKGV